MATRRRQQKLLEQLETYRTKGLGVTDEEFRAAINGVLEHGMGAQLDLATLCQVSIPTIERWRLGRSTPHRIAKRGIIIALVQYAERWLRVME